MFYYEVAPVERSYKGTFLPTYSSEIKLNMGQIVSVKLRNKLVYAFVVNTTEKPSFNIKPIEKINSGYCLPKNSLEAFKWLNNYYPGTLGATAILFAPTTITKDTHHDTQKNVDNITTKKIELTNTQQKISSEIIKSKTNIHIIHGDTGTGKTRIYIDLCNQIIKLNKSIMLLTPEIGLTPQLAEQLKYHFKNIRIIHSQISQSARRKIWLEVANSTESFLIVGPRSALFTPIKNLGLIIVDEFHDSAYKQDQSPKFQTVRVAAQIARINNSKLVLGSATPPVEDFFYATNKGALVHRITELPKIKIPNRVISFVDLSDKNQQSKFEMLSKCLINEISINLEKSEQTLIFLNKRGTSRTISCSNCGWVASCERCNIPYIYHQDKNILICHTCGHKNRVLKKCNDCGKNDLIYKNPGTKQIEANLQKLFPYAKIGRYDKDNNKSETFMANHSAIVEGKIDILIGTQILSKGHDLPKLSLVGILNGNSGLQVPDFSSAERNFQLLHQIIGRVGRGHLAGRVIVQSYGNIEKMEKIVEQNNYAWEKFYKDELQNRATYHYPPYFFMLKIEFSRKSEENLIKNISEFADKISKKYKNINIVGPAPSLISKRSNNYYWQIVIKSKNRAVLQEIISDIPNNCSYDLDPINLI